MKNREFVDRFIIENLLFDNFNFVGANQNLSVRNNVLYSYDTAIAQYYKGVLYVNVTFYSNTTSRHKGLVVRSGKKSKNCVILPNKDIPLNTTNLTKYIEAYLHPVTLKHKAA